MTVAVSPEYVEEITSALQEAWALPMSGGSEKQIAWAKNLRHEWLAGTLDTGFQWFSRRHADQVQWRANVIAQIIERVGKAQNAQWWIENRSFLASSSLGQDVTIILSAKG